MRTDYSLDRSFQPATRRRADLGGPDFYPTPRWATHALLDNEPFDGSIWECACGDGAMSHVIEEFGYSVKSSDLYDRGFGEAGVDFLESKHQATNIITNPPFHSAESFAHKARSLTSRKFAFLLRLAFLESISRATNIFSEFPPSRVWIFSERITFYPKNAVRAGTGTTAYAWFVWDQQDQGPTELSWLPVG